MAKYKTVNLSWEDYHVPIKIYKEWRKSIRFSLGRKNGVLRVPLFFTESALQAQVHKLEEWIKNHFNEDHKSASRFIIKQYHSGDTISLRDQEFKFDIHREDRKTSTASIKDNIIQFNLSKHLNPQEEYASIQKLLSRSLSKYFYKVIEQRVFYWNDLFFKKEINSIRLKYNQSNWGSCSSKGNINLSSRLLLAPEEVLDYVIVHELAHLIELNHSPKYWKLVSSVMPNYKSKEVWLKKNGHLLKF